MEISALCNAIEALIHVDDDLDQAVALLITHCKNTHTMSISGRLAYLNNMNIVGGTSPDQMMTFRNGIRVSVLTYCTGLRNGRDNDNLRPVPHSPEDEPPGGGGGVGTMTGLGLEIDVIINRDFSSYTDEEQALLMDKIRRLLEIDEVIRIKRKRPGSVVLTLDLTPAQVERLHWAIQQGELDEFDVVGSEVRDISRTGNMTALITTEQQISSFKKKEDFFDSASSQFSRIRQWMEHHRRVLIMDSALNDLLLAVSEMLLFSDNRFPLEVRKSVGIYLYLARTLDRTLDHDYNHDRTLDYLRIAHTLSYALTLTLARDYDRDRDLAYILAHARARAHARDHALSLGLVLDLDRVLVLDNMHSLSNIQSILSFLEGNLMVAEYLKSVLGLPSDQRAWILKEMFEPLGEDNEIGE